MLGRLDGAVQVGGGLQGGGGGQRQAGGQGQGDGAQAGGGGGGGAGLEQGGNPARDRAGVRGGDQPGAGRPGRTAGGQGGPADRAGGHGAVADPGRGHLVGPALEVVPEGRAQRAQRRVEVGGVLGEGEEDVVAAGEVGAFVGEQGGALGAAQGARASRR
ncbi:hypothetical protein [Kitasatospora aureofaciens]